VCREFTTLWNYYFPYVKNSRHETTCLDRPCELLIPPLPRDDGNLSIQARAMNQLTASTNKRPIPAWMWLIFGLFAMFALMTIVVAGGTWFGIKIFREQALVAIQADPAVIAELGEVHDISLDFTATLDAPGPEEFAFQVDGELADGLLVGRFVTIDADHEELRDGTLMLENGRTIAVGVVQNRPVNPQAAEADGH